MALTAGLVVGIPYAFELSEGTFACHSRRPDGVKSSRFGEEE